MTTLIELRLLLILVAVFYLPGSALLTLGRSWKRWSGLQRYLLAIGLSIAFYPILFYMARFLLPQAALSATVMFLILLLAALITAWGSWKYGAISLRLTRLEWVAVAIIGLTFMSRFWFAHAHPYPAWSDSLHHTLLTQQTAENGRLPQSLEPYFPNTLGMYHLGLYAISGVVQMLAQVPAHSALLWSSQFLNGLCGIGIYLVLDRYTGRIGAIVGLAIAGVFSPHPALWVNWGRFTQLSAQVLLPFAWVLTLETISFSRLSLKEAIPSKNRIWTVLFAAICSAAVFLLHFRVAAFYLLLLGSTAVFSLWRNRNWSQRWIIMRTLGLIGLLSLFIVMPVLWAAADEYLSARLATTVPATAAQQTQLRQNYYLFPLSSFPYLAAPVWLLITGGLAFLVGLTRRNLFVAITLVWVVSLIILGNLYLLNVPVLSVTNFGAILILFYLPLGLVIGTAVEDVMKLVPSAYRRRVTGGIVTTVLLAALPATSARSTYLEPHRHFITSQDMAAMEWIEANVPEDATFAINTYFWLPNFAHGTDAGYWLPYFTGRHIVTSSMISAGVSPAFSQRVLSQSKSAEALEADLNALDELYDMGVEYIYVGAQGDFSGPGLQPSLLTPSERVELLYENEGAVVLRIGPRLQESGG
jgi:hypothetical protein